MVQPRTASMFAPLTSPSGDADFQVLDSLAVADAIRRPQARLESGIHRADALNHADQQEGSRQVSGARATMRPAVKLPHSESSPPVVPSAASAIPQPAHEAPAAPRIGLVSVYEQAPRQQTDLSGLHVEDRDDSAPVPLALRIESPPRLVEAHHDMVRSAAAAPPSLASGEVMGRRTEPTHAVPPEPPVEVTIGRIEVTAVSTAPDAKRKSGSRRPTMSLEEYLTRRQGGRP